MSSVYPGAIDSALSPAGKTNATTMIDDHPTHHNILADAVEKVETTLGVNPQGSFADIATRLASGGATPTISNLWVPLWGYAALSTQSFGAGLLRVSRTVLVQAVKTAQMEVTTGGVGSKFRICVFADTATGPGALLYQTADIVGDATGAFTAAIGPVAAGSYWIGLQNVSSVSATLRAASGCNPLLTGLDAPGPNNAPNCWQASGQGLTIPNPFPLGSVQRTGLNAALWLQAS